MIDLVRIPVPGADDLLCGEFDGHRWAALRPMCDSLGINFAAQLRKLKARSWAVMCQMPITAADGKSYQTTVVDSESIPMWLATIHEDRVGDDAKPKLVAYQREARTVLDSYFNQRVAAPPLNQLDVLRAVLDQIEAGHRETAQVKAIAVRTEARLDAIEGHHDWFSALGYARLNGLPTEKQILAGLGRKAAKIARAQGIEPGLVQHSLYGTVNQLPAWVWDQAIGNGEKDV